MASNVLPYGVNPPAYGGGKQMTLVPVTKGVATPSDEVQAMADDWKLISALMGGTKAMRSAGEAYLPKWPNESAEKWQRRINVTTLFPAFKRTVVTLSSRPFSKPITRSEDIDPSIDEQLNDVNLQGVDLDGFAFDAMVQCMSAGFGGILVDHKRKPDDVGARPMTMAEERAYQMRPYMVLVYPHQILGWKCMMENGEHKLTMLRIMQYVDEDDGEFNVRHVEQILVLEIGRWRTYRKAASAQSSLQEWALYDSGTSTITDELPFVPLYGERSGFMCGKPPLMELAHLNVKHWQSGSDQDNLLHTARVPLLTLIGVEDSPDKPFTLLIGASGAIKLPLGAELKYVEHTGAAIDSGKTSMDDLAEQMRQSGAELLVLKPAPATATEVASDNAVGMCDLQRVTLNLQAALNKAIELMGKWQGIADPGTVKLFIDFAAATLAEATMQMVLTMSNSGIISKKTALSEGKRRAILADDVDYDAEQGLIDAEGPPTGKIDPLTGLPYKEPAPPQGRKQ